ncbi:MAG: SDR family oxidoreductase [Chloroflexi bacterium]|nr:MAG: SDR family oxidoreductase [Chloroflexota bacterium]
MTPVADIPSLAGQTAVVTGATSGLGLEAAVALARAGARVLMVGRDPVRTVAALEDVRRRLGVGGGRGTVESLLCDLSSQASIRRLAAQVLALAPSLEILVNNAGTVSVKRKVTVDDIETTFAVNHLGYYLLTRLLCDRIVASAPARIVNVASHLHYKGTLDLGDLGFERGYHVLSAYARSKLGNVLFTRELAKRLRGTGVTVTALHPGSVASNIWSGAPRWTQPLLAIAKRLFMISPEQGAGRIIYLAASPDVAGDTGLYFEHDRPTPPSPLACDDALAARLWEASARLVRLDA